MKTEKIECGTCHAVVEKPQKELTRQRKSGQINFFCSKRCSIIASNKKTPHGNLFRGHVDGRKLDKLSAFRWFIRRVAARDAQRLGKRSGWAASDLTTNHLKLLWDAQNGVCPFTKMSMRLPRSSEGGIEPDPMNASLDRVDNDLGYVVGNVRFVCLMANLARQQFTDEQLIDFCKAVAQVS